MLCANQCQSSGYDFARRLPFNMQCLTCMRQRTGSGLNVSDNTTTWHDRYDVTLCFEDTAILCGICIIFWILVGLKFVFGKQRKKTIIPRNKLNMLKMVNIAKFGAVTGFAFIHESFPPFCSC